MRLPELLALADGEARVLWDNLRLGYTETRGLPALRKEVAGLFSNVAPEGVIVAAPQELVYLTMLALLQPGDHVVAPFPGYQSLYQVALSRGCCVERWEPRLGEDGRASFSVADLKALLRPTTKLVVVNFPHNPTGALLSHAEWAELVGAVREVGAHLFSDEMYRMLELDSADRLPSAVEVYDKAIALSGVSKAYGLPGLRIGWLAVQPACYDVLDRVAELKDYTTICSSAPSEVLSLMALRARETIIARHLGTIRANMEAFAAFADEFPDLIRYSPPSAGSVAFPRVVCAQGESVDAFCERVVTGCGVLLLPATVYDHAPSEARGHFRLGLGRSTLPTCLDVLRRFLRGEGQPT